VERLLGVVGDPYPALVAFQSDPLVFLGVVDTFGDVIFLFQATGPYLLRERRILLYKDSKGADWSADVSREGMTGRRVYARVQARDL